MAVNQQFLQCDTTTLANFKNWAFAISARFSAFGWVQTSDTGQVNWGSLASVPASGSWVYEIWRPNDALQTGASQYFLKIQYGQNSSYGPELRLSLGTGTTGAGLLSGMMTAVFIINSYYTVVNSGSITYECDFSGDTGRMGALMWRSHTLPACMWFAIERTCNTDGAYNADGVTLFAGSHITGSSNGQQTLTFSYGPALQYAGCYNTITWIGNSYGSSLASEVFAPTSSVPIAPFYPSYGKYGNPCTVAGSCPNGDAGEGALVQTTLYGASRTYIATHPNSAVALLNRKLLIRYD
jgi:hypothetical protein